MKRFWKAFGGVIAVWLLASIVLEVEGRSLGTAYWMGAFVAVILFLAGLVLAIGQGELQQRLADLELREKMTCLDSNRFHLDGQTTQAWAFNIIGDARSALPLFTSAAQPVQDEFALVLRRALEGISDQFEAMPLAVRQDLRERAERLASELARTKNDALNELAGMSWAAPPAEPLVPESTQVTASPTS